MFHSSGAWGRPGNPALLAGLEEAAARQLRSLEWEGDDLGDAGARGSSRVCYSSLPKGVEFRSTLCATCTGAEALARALRQPSCPLEWLSLSFITDGFTDAGAGARCKLQLAPRSLLCVTRRRILR